MNDPTDITSIAHARKPSLTDSTVVARKNSGKDGMIVVGSEEKGHRSPGSATSDGDEPDEEELQSLRRVSGRIPWLAYSVAFVELCERFSYYGTVNIFTNFIQQPLPSSTGALYRNAQGPPDYGGHKASGALGRGQQAATGLTTFNSFWVFFTPVVGGWVADAFLGRYKTVQWSIVWALVGHIVLVISALPPVIRRPDGALAALCLGIVIMGVGTGGFKANISAMVAEQVRDRSRRIKTLKSGERVIVDPVITISRIYLYFYLMINVGSVVGSISMVYAENYVGFWLAFLLPTLMFCLCPIVLVACRNKYHIQEPAGSVLGNAFRLLSLGMKGKFSVNPVRTYRQMKSPTFWEDIKPSRLGEQRPAWMTFDDAWVDQVKRGFDSCKVFFFYPLYWLAYNQMVSNMTSQSATLNHPHVPSDLIQNFDSLALIIFIPICDFIVYPLLLRCKIRFTPLKRIAAGFFTAAIAMAVTTVLQYYIYKADPCGDQANDCDTTSTISIWVQVLPYVLVAFSEIFASITGLEYGFTKAPDNMRSLIQGNYQLQHALGSAIQNAFIPLANDPLLIWNYGVAAVLAAVGGVAFWAMFYKLDKQEDELNNLAESEFKGKMKPYGDHEGGHALGAATGPDREIEHKETL